MLDYTPGMNLINSTYQLDLNDYSHEFEPIDDRYNRWYLKYNTWLDGKYTFTAVTTLISGNTTQTSFIGAYGYLDGTTTVKDNTSLYYVPLGYFSQTFNVQDVIIGNPSVTARGQAQLHSGVTGKTNNIAVKYSNMQVTIGEGTYPFKPSPFLTQTTMNDTLSDSITI